MSRLHPTGGPIRILTNGTIERTLSQLDRTPDAIKKARIQVMKRMGTWMKRLVLRTMAKSIGITQTRILKSLRFSMQTHTDGGWDVWMGTNPVLAHYFGAIKWNRSMPGAKSGHRLFPGSWSWGYGRTHKLIMVQNPSAPSGIAPLYVPIHDDVSRAIDALIPAFAHQFETQMLKELNKQIRATAA